MKKAIVEISRQYLEDALRLPDDVFIEYIFAKKDINFPTDFKIILRGDGLPDECKIERLDPGNRYAQVSMLMRRVCFHYCDEITVIPKNGATS